MGKKVYISINFHAHEPLWGLQKHLYMMTGNHELTEMLPSTDYLKKRMENGEDLYSLAVSLAKKLEIPFGIEMSNELIQQLTKYKETAQNLGDGFHDRVIWPILGHAHHTHTRFLSEQEITREILWNYKALSKVFSVDLSHPLGYFPSECSIESSKISAIRNAGVDFTIFPHIERQEHLIRVHNGSFEDVMFKPFYISSEYDTILALPRSFALSQQIWRPLTKLVQHKARNEGYCLGLFPVLDEEFATGRTVKFPIGFEEAVEEYLSFVKQAISRCCDGGLLLFVQDLELMGVGPEMFQLLEEVLRRIKTEPVDADLVFTPLSKYAEQYLREPKVELPSAEFRQICWAPEIHGELRVDGLYLPLGVRQYRGLEGSKVYEVDPFVFWSPGSHLVSLFSELIGDTDSSHWKSVDPEQLMEIDYDISRLNPNLRISLLHLLQKTADNWGWRPDEDRQKWSFLQGYIILKNIEETTDLSSPRFQRLEKNNIESLRIYPEIFLKPRLKYLEAGLNALSKNTDVSKALIQLEKARDMIKKVYSDIADLRFANSQLGEEQKTGFLGLVSALKAFCRDFCLATDAIQKIWVISGNPEFLVVEMYKYLHSIYPPLYPSLRKGLPEFVKK